MFVLIPLGPVRIDILPVSPFLIAIASNALTQSILCQLVAFFLVPPNPVRVFMVGPFLHALAPHTLTQLILAQLIASSLAHLSGRLDTCLLTAWRHQGIFDPISPCLTYPDTVRLVFVQAVSSVRTRKQPLSHKMMPLSFIPVTLVGSAATTRSTALLTYGSEVRSASNITDGCRRVSQSVQTKSSEVHQDVNVPSLLLSADMTHGRRATTASTATHERCAITASAAIDSDTRPFPRPLDCQCPHSGIAEPAPKTVSTGGARCSDPRPVQM